MADIRDPWAFIFGRWAWSRGGYELLLPRGSQIGDIDGYLELGGRRLFIEVKDHHGEQLLPELPKGQQYALRSLLEDRDNVVWTLYGCAHLNRPYVLRVWHKGQPEELLDWRTLDADQSRDELRAAFTRFVVFAERERPSTGDAA
jgi:hypothetical protein